MSFMISTCFAALVFAVGMCMLTASAMLSGGKDGRPPKNLRIASTAVTAAGLAFLAVLGSIAFVARAHGAEASVWTEATPLEMVRMNARGFAVERKTEPEPGQLFVYSRYGCPDCEAVLPELDEEIKASGLPFAGYYSTRTEIGRALLEKYPIQAVPTLVWLDADGWAEYCDPCAVAEDGTVSLDAEGVRAFLQKIEQGPEAADVARTAIEAYGALRDVGIRLPGPAIKLDLGASLRLADPARHLKIRPV